MTTTTTIAITPLTDAQKRVARHLVRGTTIDRIAAREHLSRDTVKSYLGNVRESLNCPPRSTRAVLVHALLTHWQVPPPSAPRPDVELDAAEQKLLRAHAEHSRADDIARAAGIAPGDLRAQTAVLVRKVGAADSTHLVGIGHALRVLGGAGQLEPDRDAAPGGADR